METRWSHVASMITEYRNIEISSSISYVHEGDKYSEEIEPCRLDTE